MILVVGATGLLGHDICKRLRARNIPVRGLVRADSPRAESLRSLGVEVHKGDLRNAADLAGACAGVRAVISTATAMGSKDKGLTLRDVDHNGQLALVRAAEASQVERFLFISAAAAMSSDAPLIRYKRVVESALRATGMKWTILQPSVFMEVWLSKELGWDIPARKATIFGPGTDPMSWISVHDVAECAVRCLDDPRFYNVNVPMGGPQALSPKDVTAIFERVSGHKWTVKHVPIPILRMLRPIVGLFNEQAASGMAMGSEPKAAEMRDLSRQAQLGVDLTTVEQHVQRVLAK